MPITKLSIAEFITMAPSFVLLDVRSPGEYAHAHIPEAISLPLFTDEERKVVGTAYKQESREKAIKIGLDFFGKNMVVFVEQVEKIVAIKSPTSREVCVHCWRGGMRSAAIAWLLDLYGFKVYLLQGGYKVYRHWVLQQFEKPYRFHVIGGYTGSNKTGVIDVLKTRNEKVIDIEKLAGHMGSAFGNLSLTPQPSQEFFENRFATELHRHTLEDVDAFIWIEDESQRLGLVNIPLSLFKNIRQQSFLFLDIPFQKRLQHIIAQYGKYEKEKLINAIVRIKKKLGGLETKNSINFIVEDDVENCFTILLQYYDKLYLKGSSKRENFEEKCLTIKLTNTDAEKNAIKLLDYVRNKQ
jgi:tRNA 2-selenouridine synthase